MPGRIQWRKPLSIRHDLLMEERCWGHAGETSAKHYRCTAAISTPGPLNARLADRSIEVSSGQQADVGVPERDAVAIVCW